MSEQALQKIEVIPQDMALEPRHAGPLDMEPAAFRAGLDRRKDNRKALMDWIRSALVENVDYGRIQTKRGLSRPSLLKPGAEKICGMLGVFTTFLTLTQYEQAAFSGTEIKSVVLRCALLDSRGIIVAEGVGARTLAQDYGDLNKALKMAEKSAHIDATLRMAGLSEVFTQDLEDMPPQADIQPQRPSAATAKPPGSGQHPEPGERASKAAASLQATDKTRAWFLAEMRKCFSDATLLQWACDDGPPYVLMPNQTLTEWPLDKVPTNREALKAMIERCSSFMGASPQEASGTPTVASDPPNTTGGQPSGASQCNVAPKKAVSEPAHHSEEWYQFPMPFGKNSGTILGKLQKNYLYGLWKNYTVETEYNGKPKKKETIEADRTFRVMLDRAGIHYRFDEPTGGDIQGMDAEGDPIAGSDDVPEEMLF